MERKGVYQKGRAGHVRNVSSYYLSRQKFRKWRTPVTAFLAFLFVFGAAPIVGDNYQTSLLTNGETQTVLQEYPDQARKVLLSALSDFLKDCDRFKLNDCAARGSVFVSNLANASSEQLPQIFVSLQDFESEFEPEIARMACVYDLGKFSVESRASSSSVSKFFERYGEALGKENPASDSQSEYLKLLEDIVSECRNG